MPVAAACSCVVTGIALSRGIVGGLALIGSTADYRFDVPLPDAPADRSCCAVAEHGDQGAALRAGYQRSGKRGAGETGEIAQEP